MPENFSKEFWLSAGGVAGSLAIAAALLAWVSHDVTLQADRISLSRQMLVQHTRSLEVLASLKKNDRDVETYKKLMEQILPTKEELLDFSREFEDASRVNQVGLNFAFQPGATILPQNEQPGSVGFRFDVSGSLSSLQNFFAEIEKKSSRFLVSVDTIDVQANEAGYRAAAQAKVFFR